MDRATTPTATPDSSFQLCRLIGKIRSEFVYDLEKEMSRHGVELNFSQFLALKLLGCESPMAPGELARALHYNPGALTRLLDKLEQRGYLKRVPDPVDRRVVRLELTLSGKAIRKRVIESSSIAAERAFACTSERERAQLHKVLSRVLDGMCTARERHESD